MYCVVATDSTCIVLFILPQHGSLCSFKFNIYTLFSQYQLNIYCCVPQYYLNMYIFVATLTIKTVHLNVNKEDVSSNSSIIIILLTSNPKYFLHKIRPSIIEIHTLYIQFIFCTGHQGNCIWRLRWNNVFVLHRTSSKWMKFKVGICFRFSR